MKNIDQKYIENAFLLFKSGAIDTMEISHCFMEGIRNWLLDQILKTRIQKVMNGQLVGKEHYLQAMERVRFSIWNCGPSFGKDYPPDSCIILFGIHQLYSIEGYERRREGACFITRLISGLQ